MAKKSGGLLNQNIVVENEIVEAAQQENLVLESQVYEEKTIENVEEIIQHKEEIVKKWEDSGILDKLENNLDENIVKQFESKSSFTINEPIGIKSVSQLSKSEFRTYQRTGILPSI